MDTKVKPFSAKKKVFIVKMIYYICTRKYKRKNLN